MPVRRSRQGSNSFAAKLITRANSAKVNNSVTSSNNQSSYTINGSSSGNFNNNNNINPGGSTSLLHTNGTIVNNNPKTSNTTNGRNNGTGILLTAKQQHQLQRNAYLSTLNKDQLKLECRKRGQKTSGTKLDLVYMTNDIFSILNTYISCVKFLPFFESLSNCL